MMMSNNSVLALTPFEENFSRNHYANKIYHFQRKWGKKTHLPMALAYQLQNPEVATEMAQQLRLCAASTEDLTKDGWLTGPQLQLQGI